MNYIERDCTIEHNGNKFSSGGAVVTPDFLVAYPAANGVLNDWHGKPIGIYKTISSRPAVFFGRRSWMGDTYYFMRAKVNGREYAIRGFGEGMSATGKAIKSIASMSPSKVFARAGAFAQAYIKAALWSSTTEDGVPLDRDYNWTHLDDATLKAMIDDCEKFQNEANLTGYPIGHAGYDFWLTRNGHGVGFWENDYGTEEQCEALTKASEAFGSCDLYVGDDGKIYLM